MEYVVSMAFDPPLPLDPDAAVAAFPEGYSVAAGTDPTGERTATVTLSYEYDEANDPTLQRVMTTGVFAARVRLGRALGLRGRETPYPDLVTVATAAAWDRYNDTEEGDRG